MFYDTTEAPPLSQLSQTMVSQMQDQVIWMLICHLSAHFACKYAYHFLMQATITRDVDLGPLPDSTFISSNQPAAKPIPPITATRVRKKSAKAQAAADEQGKKKAAVKKKA